jgi:hypothetical protein
MSHNWDEQATAHLFLSIAEYLNLTFTPGQKVAIVAKIEARGHGFNWNAIR